MSCIFSLLVGFVDNSRHFILSYKDVSEDFDADIQKNF